MEAVSGRFTALKRGGSMATACIAHCALRVHGISKPIIAAFDQPQASSDGGVVLLKAVLRHKLIRVAQKTGIGQSIRRPKLRVWWEAGLTGSVRPWGLASRRSSR